jgi:hypothetical protein
MTQALIHRRGMTMRRTLKKKQNDIILCWRFSFLFCPLRHTSGWLLLVIELAVAPQRECSGFYRGPPTRSPRGHFFASGNVSLPSRLLESSCHSAAPQNQGVVVNRFPSLGGRAMCAFFNYRHSSVSCFA